ncbi:hypothetical protein CDL15_Pgr004973 [Punica granatum]|uniref:3'-5' exonuclease n=1 Tax=Punica granatum TaxID=22663 RepID=A0A218WWZ8_PUNGR|nr:hypothetical protein CDL15_Pgr004973 [Punica granatum]
METPNNPVVSGSTATSSGLTGGVSIAIPGWDEPLTEEELEAIDASVEAASAGRAPNHKKRRPPEAEDSRIETPRRRLPRSSSLSPCQVNEVMRYPSMAFGGRILYSRTTVEVEKSAAELLKKINALKRLTDQVTIGFDIEWRPTFRRGAPLRKAAVMQICCNTDDCYVMHIVHSNIPQSLKLILEDRAVIKVGVGIVNDAVKVQKDYNVSVQACEDLSWLANEKLHHDQRNWSLAHLTEILVSKQDYRYRIAGTTADSDYRSHEIRKRSSLEFESRNTRRWLPANFPRVKTCPPKQQSPSPAKHNRPAAKPGIGEGESLGQHSIRSYNYTAIMQQSAKHSVTASSAAYASPNAKRNAMIPSTPDAISQHLHFNFCTFS